MSKVKGALGVQNMSKIAKWFTPNIRRIDFAAINVNTSKWLENDFAECGVLLRGANGMPLVYQISRHPCADALQADAKANLKGYKIAVAQSRFNIVSLYADAGHVVDFVADNRTNKRTWIDFAAINVDASKWLENDFAGCGVLLRGANGMPLICQISRHPCADALQADAKANLEGYKIAAAQSRFNMVFLYADAGHVVDFVADNKTNKRTW
ncbi:hypothetical protein FH972_011753 [Carpinus fangiana]|uniref:Uncharacterized protein n=1 Tax=Carpinus fangiana TaxID=176857 RepID=A0A660KYB4_9ROSI|nr:hypothetical protein FH972_011753 [Carpinus fangiana]